jgi:hypothetical protein
VPERDNSVQAESFMPILRVRECCTHFPLAFTRRAGATPLLGRRLRAGRTFASPRRLARGFGSSRALVGRFGRPLA